jgi:very-short-patch-repair endonuclease
MLHSAARRLRRNETACERVLWRALRDRRLAGHTFRRQHPIDGSVVDFAGTPHHLVIAADGGQHADSPADARRMAALQANGWRVIRFWNNDILENTEGVISTIRRARADG